MEEIWKDIPGYEGCYQASTEGRIKSLARYSKEYVVGGVPHRIRIKERILKGSPDADGYLNVDLYDPSSGKPKTWRVNRLIALTFIPNPDSLPQVDHLNCIKDDNRVCNLEWVSCKENINRAWKAGRCKPPEVTEEKRERFRQLGKRMVTWRGQPCRCIEENKSFICVADAARYYGVHECSIRDWIENGHNNKIKAGKCIGLNFEYISKDSDEYKELLGQFYEKLAEETEANPRS